LKNANTGDLLLFRANNIGASIVRFITRSYFDHVAVLLKYSDDPEELYFIDSTSSNGVGIYKWSDVKSHYGIGLFYQTIVYRSVEFERSEDVL
jgi:hypothetical protein